MGASFSSQFFNEAGEQNVANLTLFLPLYKAILKGDIETVKGFCQRDPNALEARITVNSDTALHVAVGTGTANHIVRYLVQLMSVYQLGLTNSDGDTVLSIAAIVGNIEAATMILRKRPNLSRIANHDGRAPLLEAARHGQKEMISYLLRVSEENLDDAEYSADKPGAFFMNLLVIAGFYELVQSHPRFATVEYYGGESLLSALAAKATAFPSGTQFKFWQRLMYYCYSSELNCPVLSNAVDVENPEDPHGFGRLKLGCISCRRINNVRHWLHSVTFRALVKLVPGSKGICAIKSMHHQTLQLVRCLCAEISRLEHPKASSILRRPFLLAAELGIWEIVEEIMESFPHAVRLSDLENHNVFQIAVIYRQESVFNLIYQMSDYKHLLLVSQDTSGNNILHLAGKLAPQHRLNLISGAALQMQRELQWFREVEMIVQPAYKEDKNSEGKTPAMVFREEHKKLVKEGEKWMKGTASSCTVAAALIATVVFAAAITVPGGSDNNDGNPIFSKQVAFIIFGIADAISLFSSIAAILMFLSILTARYTEADFLYTLPTALIFGLVTLFLSITSMMVAFSATLLLVFCHRKAWMLVPVGALACLPVTLFVSLQFPLLVDIIHSTYKPDIFGKKGKRMLY